MIPSTAKVAIPAASPERRMSGRPTRSANAPADDRRDEQRRHVPDGRRAQEVEEVRHRRRLLLLGDREDSRGPDADREEADVAEREHAGVPDEDVDRDDRRDRDERGDEVDLVRLRDDRADEARRDDQQRGRQELDDRAPRSSHALHEPAPAREQPVRPQEEDEDHEAEEERRQVLALGWTAARRRGAPRRSR